MIEEVLMMILGQILLISLMKCLFKSLRSLVAMQLIAREMAFMVLLLSISAINLLVFRKIIMVTTAQCIASLKTTALVIITVMKQLELKNAYLVMLIQTLTASVLLAIQTA